MLTLRRLAQASVSTLLALSFAATAAVDPRETEREREELAKSRGESLDHAARRAQAFHDMYADEFGRVDPEQKLRAAHILQIESRLRDAQARDAQAIGGSNFVNIGPTNFAGRVSVVTVDPNNSSIVYRGTAGGGVWKSTDSGSTWNVLTDSLGDLSIGAVAVAKSNSNLVYVGTGEGALGIDGINGIGFVKSTDAGATWSLPVSVSATKFFEIDVHPTNANEILAATTVGIQKSTDGGATWVTKFSTYAGTDLIRIPGTPSTIVATAWDVTSASPTWKGFGYRSTDSGETWTQVINPGTAPWNADNGRMSLAVAPSAPSTLFAIAASAAGDSKGCASTPVDQWGIYRSTDAGLTWTFRSNPVTGACGSYSSILSGQGWYASTISVDPANANIVYAGGLDTWKSTDGGATFVKRSSWSASPSASNYVHADIHDMAWIGTTLLIGNDGGINRTTDGASTFTNLNTNVVTRQYYNIAVTPANRDLLIGGAQDNGTNLRTTNTTSYTEQIGGDGFGVAAHPTNAATLYGTVYSTRIFRSTNTGASFAEIGPSYGSDNAPFITPLTMDPNNPSILYTGTNYCWKSTNGGTNWTKTSTTVLGDTSTRNYVTKIAVAKSNSSYVLAGTGNGYVRLSTNGGTTWSAALAGGLPTKYVAHVEFDPTNVNTFYVAYAGGSTGGRIFKTTNGGTSFTQIDTGVPNFPVHVLRVDPTDVNALYAGSDLGLYRSTDGGTSWARFGTGMPAVSIWDIAILPDGSMMRIGTHGRGFWELQIAAPITYAIAGSAGTTGATVTAGAASTTSDGSNNYTLSNLAAGTYTVTPTKSGCTFTPASQSVTVGPNATGINFSASCPVTTYSIAGNAGTTGATVTAGSASATSDASSNYTISGLAAGTYTVTPSKSGCTFTPASQSVTVGPNATGKNFTASCTTGDTQLTSGVTLTGQSVALQQWKYYYITVPAGATNLTFTTSGATTDLDIYTQVTNKPTLSSYICRPYGATGNETCSATNPAAGTWWLGVYGYAAGSFSVVGTVTTPVATYTIAGNAGTTGVTVTAGSASATSDASGNYTLSGLVAGTYTVTATKTGCTFSPASQSVTVGPNATGKNFTATCGGGCTPQQLLANAGFESGAVSWTGTTASITNSASKTPRTGSYYAWLGGNGTAVTETLSQTVTIPACATTATLSFYLKIDTAETTTATAYDKLTVKVKSTGGSTLATLVTYSNLNKGTSYVLRSFNLAAYAGQTIVVELQSIEDGSLQTSFVIDDSALNTN